jgi:alpha-tubulin suppressor-like RCC1 family protein
MPNAADAQAGGEHSLLRTSNGAVFSAGACGLGWSRLQALHPSLFAWRRVPLPEPASSVVPGYYHNLAIGRATGRLYSWGCGTFPGGGNDGSVPALGQGLEGVGDVLDVGNPPKAVMGRLGVFIGGGRRGEEVGEEAGEEAGEGAADVAIAAAAGAYHSVVLTSLGRVLTFGAAQLGQLGRSVGGGSSAGAAGAAGAAGVASAAGAVGFVGAAGASGAAAKETDEAGAACAARAAGAVTDGSGLPVDPVPREVEGLPNPFASGDPGDTVRSIGAGFYNTLVVCQSGALFCGGENQNRQCGRDPSPPLGGDQSNLHYMARATDFEGYKIVEASGGYCHTLALTDTGRVLSIGCGDDGQ